LIYQQIKLWDMLKEQTKGKRKKENNGFINAQKTFEG
jgi:hypothetical protein